MRRRFSTHLTGSAWLLLAGLLWTCNGACAAEPILVPPGTTYEGGWQEQYLGGATDVPFFPDGNASYWVYRLERGTQGAEGNEGAPDSRIGLRLRGQFPRTRYMSVTVYDDRSFSVLTHIPDLEIKPETGINPFAGVEPGADPVGTYEIAIVPAGAPAPPDANLVEYDPTIGRVSVFLRYYLPEGDDTGGVPLPTLSAFDIDTAEELELPTVELALQGRVRAQNAVLRFVARRLHRRLDELFAANGPGPLLFSFRTDVQRFYANPDNHYLAIPILKGADKVAIIRFMPPTTPAGTSAAGPPADTRYWSVGLGNEQSFNLYTLADFQAKVDPDGHVYVVLGEPTPEIEGKAKARSFNFIPWTLGERGVLIYRNLLTRPGFAGDLALVPAFAAGRDWRAQTAQRFIGDYAPSGTLISVQEFLDLE